jgi:Alpha/beta hydrolase domain
MRRELPVHRLVLVAVGLVALVGACSSEPAPNAAPDGPAGSTGGTNVTGNKGTSTSDRPPRQRPVGPAATLEEITAPGTPFIAAGNATDLPPGYVEHEYVASGTATSYRATTSLSTDGAWTFEPGATAPYRTRVLVRRPADPAKFSGSVFVEWLNVSGGADANPEYVSAAEELVRQGHAWVGVSAQLIGVEGGPVLVQAPGGEGIAGKGLKGLDPARYGSLAHPGDGFSFDIYTQVTRALRDGGAALGGSRPAAVVAAGESQSAVALTTYYNGVQPLTDAFDGFLIHSRGSGALPVVEAGRSADIAGSMGRAAYLFRTDLDAPILDLQTEGDVVGVLSSLAVRQPDTDRFRLWEVAGAAHADKHLVGANAGQFDCGVAINNAPMHLVVKAGLRALDGWVRTGQVPPAAPRLEVTGVPAAIQRDQDGIAVGGIRTPPVDVPVDVLSGMPGPKPDVICLLLGSTRPLPAARLAELYPSPGVYTQRYEAATDAAIRSGFVLREDRDAMIGYAEPSRITPPGNTPPGSS